MSDNQRGRVKRFNVEKGFGFIESKGQEYFVHISALLTSGCKSLPMGAAVLFKPAQGKKGLEAHDVIVL